MLIWEGHLQPLLAQQPLYPLAHLRSIPWELGWLTAGKLPEIALAGSIPQIGQSHRRHISNVSSSGDAGTNGSTGKMLSVFHFVIFIQIGSSLYNATIQVFIMYSPEYSVIPCNSLKDCSLKFFITLFKLCCYVLIQWIVLLIQQSQCDQI